MRLSVKTFRPDFKPEERGQPSAVRSGGLYPLAVERSRRRFEPQRHRGTAGRELLNKLCLCVSVVKSFPVTLIYKSL